jgi:Spy/CpxP family protein refolding chaperone
MQQIRNIRFQTKRQHIQLKARIQLARLELRQLLNQQKPDATLVSQAIDKAGKLHLQLKKQRILARLKMQAVLTTKQFEVWKQIRARRHARRRRWKKMRRMRRMRRMRNMQ